MEEPNNHQDDGSNVQNEYEVKTFVSIQEYMGEEYQLYDGSAKTLAIVKNHADDIADAIKQFFQNTYNTYVKVHNMVSAKDGVTVLVESVNKPYFHTFAIVPIDEKQKKVKLDSIWSQEGEVERAIKGGLYVMAFAEEFTVLDEYLEGITARLPIIGTPARVIDMVKANGYTTPYYFISTSGNVFKELFEKYKNNPDITGTDTRGFFAKHRPDPTNINIGIEFYMKEKDAIPKREILDTIVVDIEKMTDIPMGAYSFYLNDNQIDKKRGVGKKDNTVEKTSPDKVLKEYSQKGGGNG